ncbi:UNVERIFIED_CONTAM: hypothetical protein FKN15_061485 [Acipenser sinensis]
MHELEEERRLRLESEKRLGEVTVESEQSTAHMLSLQQQLSRYKTNILSKTMSPSVLYYSMLMSPLYRIFHQY